MGQTFLAPFRRDSAHDENISATQKKESAPVKKILDTPLDTLYREKGAKLSFPIFHWVNF